MEEMRAFSVDKSPLNGLHTPDEDIFDVKSSSKLSS